MFQFPSNRCYRLRHFKVGGSRVDLPDKTIPGRIGLDFLLHSVIVKLMSSGMRYLAPRIKMKTEVSTKG